ncbi:hypothetical protein [Pseudoalteromonas rubra]|uniref:Uncharacterized protein n=1 Tax=Pseudoalteromonas rubra TaxID=43658 RepID=A0A0F4QFZ9_9GAMM|nr:hypothetical protein [Pseudoalteromonas rubra]KJZ06511.1 hypothetical protein TW77_18570 [Pseudoalteromonas rubra]
MEKNIKPKAPLLALIYNLVFVEQVSNEFNRSPRKVAEVFGLSDEEFDFLITAGATGDFKSKLIEKLADEVSNNLSRPQLLIPNLKEYKPAPTLSANFNVIHDGSIADYILEKNEQNYQNFFDTFGLTDPKVQQAFRTGESEVEAMSEAIQKELATIVENGSQNT